MTDKKPTEQNAGASNAEAQLLTKTQQGAESQADTQSAISALQSELNTVKEILKSLETQATAPKATQDSQKFTSEQAKQIAANDFKKIAQLVATGKISPQQGAALKKNVLQKAFGSDTLPQRAASNPTPTVVNGNPLVEFEQSNPDFFTSDARNAVKSYLQQEFETISPDELTKVVDLIRMIEEAAISSFQQSQANETAIKETNSEAIKRLQSSAASGAKPTAGGSKMFTREQIGKMSPDEFRQNEAEIMQQLKKGQIK